jgi:hypothetical protein
MPGDVDPRLIGLLQGVLGLADSLSDVGAAGDITVRLGRDDGLALLKLVAGSDDAEAEAASQHRRPRRHGVNTLKLASLTFEWPRADAARRRPQASRMFSAAPAVVATGANDNSPDPAPGRFYGFDGETPALR